MGVAGGGWGWGGVVNPLHIYLYPRRFFMQKKTALFPYPVGQNGGILVNSGVSEGSKNGFSRAGRHFFGFLPPQKVSKNVKKVHFRRVFWGFFGKK